MPKHTAAKRKANLLAKRLRPTKKEMLKEIMSTLKNQKSKKRRPAKRNAAKTMVAKKDTRNGVTFT